MRTVTMLDAALEYATHGAAVFPVWWAHGSRCACPASECANPAKHPIAACAPNGFQNATTDTSIIRRWWSQWPDANIATPTGITSTVLDVDPAKGGRATLARLLSEHGPFPTTGRVLTGGGGDHYHFAPVPGLRNSAGVVGPGLDIRGAGGYVLLAPSTHVSGGTYRDDPDASLYDTPLAPMPLWLITKAQAQAARANNGAAGNPSDWATLLSGTLEGQRHAVACRIAGHYLGLGLLREEVEAILLGFAARCVPPLPVAEARRIVVDLADKNTRTFRQASRPLIVVGAGDFLAQHDPESVALVEGVLSDDGGGWLGGEEKLGKSWWMIEEAACLAFGLPVCGRFTVPARRRVLVLEEEDSPRRVKRRLRALLRGKGMMSPDLPEARAELNAWLRVSVWSGFSLDNEDMVAQLHAILTEFRPAVVYIDCLRKVTVKNLNHADEASVLLGILDAMRREFGVVFRLIHHYRKQQGFRTGRGSQEIGGSFVLGAWGENSLFFEPIGRKSGAVRIEVQSKDGAPLPAFRLRLESDGPAHAPTEVRLSVEDDADGFTVDEVVADAVATLPATPAVTGKAGVTVDALALAIKKSDRTVRDALKRLIAARRCLEVGTVSKGKKLFGVNS